MAFCPAGATYTAGRQGRDSLVRLIHVVTPASVAATAAAAASAAASQPGEEEEGGAGGREGGAREERKGGEEEEADKGERRSKSEARDGESSDGGRGSAAAGGKARPALGGSRSGSAAAPWLPRLSPGEVRVEVVEPWVWFKTTAGRYAKSYKWQHKVEVAMLPGEGQRPPGARPGAPLRPKVGEGSGRGLEGVWKGARAWMGSRWVCGVGLTCVRARACARTRTH